MQGALTPRGWTTSPALGCWRGPDGTTGTPSCVRHRGSSEGFCPFSSLLGFETALWAVNYLTWFPPCTYLLIACVLLCSALYLSPAPGTVSAVRLLFTGQLFRKKARWARGKVLDRPLAFLSRDRYLPPSSNRIPFQEHTPCVLRHGEKRDLRWFSQKLIWILKKTLGNERNCLVKR